MVADADAKYPLTIDPTWSETTELMPSDGNGFGDAVSISGNRAVVGDPYTSGDDSQGAVYIFTLVDGSWTQSAEIFDPTTGTWSLTGSM